ncbi:MULTISPECIES: hsdR [Enterobacteriaceae]|jgi:RNA polymerase subunit RPABC4/transcription elongation factor Spt4|uniref:HsdR n=1 Tax=Leclercia adecarboxylata TaxID=83655 RepID=A0A6H0A4B1_9ENTR|nr:MULTISPECIES: hsdR [Enterobacteriaceae]UNJ80239.1 hypothetical protein [Leclercia sp.]MCW4706092.1 hsdR [Enterobacter kobei]MDV5241774.1 hsdR [Leclercia adecarboxylata]MDV5280005.1 hsdR [Leclercia adecarboxylata]MDV5463944.1 hsdR [Leclercia adecarboxylata]
MIDDDDHVPYEILENQTLSHDVQALINNGLDFLDQAREELEAGKPKHSVVSFWTAVEILLKVPLAHEHWSLVCSRKYPPKKQSYLNGDFHSISYDETRALLRDVLEKPLTVDTHQIFDKVRMHRNRLVHFYHPEFTDSQSKQILNEQADAWFRLHQLICKDWRHIFGEDLYYKLSLDESRMLRTSHYYIGAKFRSLTGKLDDLRKKGFKITKCSRCEQKAGIHSVFNEENEHKRFETDCLVCGYVTSLFLEVTCPNCNSKQRIEEDGDTDFTCAQCNHTLSRYDLLDESTLSPEDQMIMGGPINCSDCDGYETVCEFGGELLCTKCLALHESAGICEHCGGHSTYINENSGLFGCGLCSGNQSFRDDD